MLIACDGASSRVRRILFPDQPSYKLPVGVLGVRVDYSSDQCDGMRRLDPFFLQATSPANAAFSYFSGKGTITRPPSGISRVARLTGMFTVLDAPGNGVTDKYTYQMVVSWPLRPGILGQSSPIVPPAADKDRLELIRALTSSWAEPFRSFILSLPEDIEVKALELTDWPPPRGLRTKDQVLLMGDALHAMTMCMVHLSDDSSIL